MQKIAQAAQRYIVEKDWKVIPATLKRTQDGTKEVFVKSQYWDKDTVEKGLDDPTLAQETFATSNALGVVTGHRSGLTVLDFDIDKETGELGTSIDGFPETYTVKTQSGGFHLYYQYYSEIKTSANIGGDKYPKLDARNDGGFVFAPPTEIDGVQMYEVVNDIDPQPFPIEHFKDIKASKKNTAQYKGPQAIKVFESMDIGERDIALFNYAEAEYRKADQKTWPYIDLAVQSMNSLMKWPLKTDQVHKIILSARKYQNEAEKELNLITDKKGNPQAVLNNVVNILENDNRYTNQYRYNTFTGDVESLDSMKWSVIDIAVETSLRLRLGIDFPFLTTISAEIIGKAIGYVAYKTQVSPPMEYLKGLKWDKKPRLKKWIHKTYPIEENNIYYEEMGANFLIASVNRLGRPGCQVDNVLVLDSGEGQGKSKSLRILSTMGSDLQHTFNETSDSPEGKDFVQNLLGTTITEFSEGAVAGHKDRKRVKSFITKLKDKYRPPYERSAMNFPRQCVFAMSTNDSQYIEDEGKNRRWWPVALERGGGQVHCEWLEENIQQMYAEAYHRREEQYWMFTPEADNLLNELRDDKRVEDEVHLPIYLWYQNLTDKEMQEGISKSDGWDIISRDLPSNKYGLKLIGEYYTDKLKLKQKRVGGKRLFVPTKESPKYIPDEFNNF